MEKTAKLPRLMYYCARSGGYLDKRQLIHVHEEINEKDCRNGGRSSHYPCKVGMLEILPRAKDTTMKTPNRMGLEKRMTSHSPSALINCYECDCVRT